LFIIFTSGFYITLDAKNISSILSIIILIALILFIKYLNKSNLFPWERMVAIEQQHHMNYHKFVNIFTDVKQIEESAVRINYLVLFLRASYNNKLNENSMYLYLFTRRFARVNVSFNIILRLVIIALILMICLHQVIGVLIIG